MADFKNINEFRKGSILRKISEDPTYLSFFFMFDTVDREHSPLLSGAAEDYLKNFVDTPAKTQHAVALANFKKVLMKINRELPWFWQRVIGLELTQTHTDMKEPWRGAEKPKIDIECLEENVELTAIGLMSLYKQAVYDYHRYIEILPKNLRHFRVWIVMSEVRTFQQDVNARNKDLYGSEYRENKGSDSIDLFSKTKGTSNNSASGKFDSELVKNYTADSKPHVMVELDFCEWIQDSIADMYADLNKQPELKKPKISFTWQRAHTTGSKFGPNITSDADSNLFPSSKPNDGLYPETPFNPLQNAQNAITDKVNGIANSLAGRFENLKDSLPGQGKNPMGAVYPEGFTGAAANLVNSGKDKLKALFMDNVHGASGTLGTIGDINTALEAGSINAIANLAGQLFNQRDSKPGNDNISPDKIYGPGIDSSPDEFINERVYDPIPQEPNSQSISPGRIYEPGVDSSPDDNLNENVHK